MEQIHTNNLHEQKWILKLLCDKHYWYTLKLLTSLYIITNLDGDRSNYTQ